MSTQGSGGPQDPYQQQPNQPPYQQQPYQQQPYQQPFPGGHQPGPQFGGQPPWRPVGDPGTLDLPWYGIGFGQAIKRAFAKYVRFDGRASRSEFWWFYLFNAIVSTVLSIPYIIAYVGQAPAMMNGEPPQLGRLALADSASLVWSLVVLLPTLGLFWRRLHDTGRSGAWWFLSFACGIGALVPLIMCILDSDPTGQRYDRVHDARGPAPGGYGR